MKKLLLICSLIILLSGWSYGTDEIKVKIDDEMLTFTEIRPVILEGRTLLPMKVIFEELGFTIQWHHQDKKVIGTLHDLVIEMKIDDPSALVNGRQVVLDVPAKILNNTTYVPVKFVAEGAGAQVFWDNTTKTVIINTIKNEEEQFAPSKNIYHQSFLEDLVKVTPCDSDVMAFREQDNLRRAGLLKVEGKYFDLYYPDDPKAKRTADLLRPHMDKVYMMLVDLYGVQAKAEVHLIHEEDAYGLQEGRIRQEERVTFVWLEAFNDGPDGLNNLAEFIHELNHNFFDDPRVNNGATNTMWINEANAKLIPSLYLYHTDLANEVDTWSFYQPILQNKEDLLDLVSTDAYLRQPRSWGKASGDLRKAQLTGLHLVRHLYNFYGLDDYKHFLRNLGHGEVLPVLQELLTISLDQLNQDLLDGIE